MQKKTGKRIVSLLLIAAVCFAMLFSACYIAAEAHHDCCGEGCAVCAQIMSCENILKSVFIISLFAVISLTALIFAENRASFTEKLCESVSLVALKVELLN